MHEVDVGGIGGGKGVGGKEADGNASFGGHLVDDTSVELGFPIDGDSARFTNVADEGGDPGGTGLFVGIFDNEAEDGETVLVSEITVGIVESDEDPLCWSEGGELGRHGFVHGPNLRDIGGGIGVEGLGLTGMKRGERTSDVGYGLDSEIGVHPDMGVELPVSVLVVLGIAGSGSEDEVIGEGDDGAFRVLDNRIFERGLEPGTDEDYEVGTGNRADTGGAELEGMRIGPLGDERINFETVAGDVPGPVSDDGVTGEDGCATARLAGTGTSRAEEGDAKDEEESGRDGEETRPT